MNLSTARLSSRRRMVPGFVALALTTLVLAQPVAAQGPPPSGPFEAKLTFDNNYAEGEPSIAVNPKNPRNIIVTFLVNTGLGAYAAQGGQVPPTTRDHEQTIQGCDYVVTFDGGRTWKRSSLPITNFQIAALGGLARDRWTGQRSGRLAGRTVLRRPRVHGARRLHRDALRQRHPG